MEAGAHGSAAAGTAWEGALRELARAPGPEAWDRVAARFPAMRSPDGLHAALAALRRAGASADLLFLCAFRHALPPLARALAQTGAVDPDVVLETALLGDPGLRPGHLALAAVAARARGDEARARRLLGRAASLGSGEGRPMSRRHRCRGAVTDPFMVERHVYLKLVDALADPAGRAVVAAEARRVLGSLPSVQDVRIGVPADDPSAASWDVTFTVRFADVEALAAYLADPEHRAWSDGWLAPRVAFRKAWNFRVS